MMYSCFDDKTGLYDYFVDSSGRPINGDMPIPKLPESTGRIGVPAIEAGRSLPSGAKHIGRGWHARGVVVNCGKTGPLGAIDMSSGTFRGIAAGSAIAFGLMYFFGRPARPSTYAIAVAAGGLAGYLFAPKESATVS